MAVKFKNSININDQYTFPSVVGTDGQYLSITNAASGTLDWTNIGDVGGVDGSGTTNYVPKWTDGDTIGNSVIYDDGTNVGIGTTSPSKRLTVNSSTVNVGIKVISTDAGSTISFEDNTTNGDNVQVGASGDDMYFIAGGGERMRIDSSGRVGIGTTNPSARFQVNTSDITKFLGTNADYVSGSIGSGVLITTGASTGNTYSQIYAFQSGNTAYANLVVPGGNVGIGTTSPSAKMHIYDGIGSATTLLKLQTNFNSPSGNKSIVWSDSASDVARISVDYTAPMSKMRFGSIYNSGYQTGDAMVIQGNGNVGIGTSSPNNKLTIQTGASEDDILPVLGANGGKFSLLNNNGLYGLLQGVLGSGNSFIQSQRVDGTATAYGLLLNPNGGNVGIGTTSPGVKLQVNGIGEFAGALRITEGGTAQSILIGNQDSGGTNKPSIINGVNGALRFGWGSTWSGEGGTFTETLQLKSDGNAYFTGSVGIGLTSPSAKLHILQQSAGIASAYSSAIIEGVDAQLDITSSSAGTWGSAINLIEGIGSSNNNIWSIARTTSSGGNNLRFNFGTSNQHDNPTKVTFDSNGNVGIGTSSPSRTFHVHTSTATDIHLTTTASGTSSADGATISLSGTQMLINQRENDVMRFQTNATERMRITASGNVGIGTNNPTEALMVEGWIRVANNTGIKFNTSASSGDPTLNIDSSAHWNFLNTAGSNLLKIDNGGNVGIGTTNPTAKLTLGGNAVGSTEGLRINDPSNAAYGAHFSFSDTPNEVWIGGVTNNTYNSAIGIHRETTRAITIDVNGNVGIGTTSPSVKLEIGAANDGDVVARLTQTYERVRLHNFDLLGYGDGHLWMLGNNSYTSIVLGNSWDWDRQVEFNYISGTTGSGDGLLTIGQTQKNSTNYTHGVTRFYTAGSERMRIDQNGNVGIGTTSPTSLLEISKQLSAASAIDYPYTISSRDDGNSINQAGGEGVGIKFRIAGNAATTPGDSLVGASIAAIRENAGDTDSSTGLGFFVTQNDETLDEAVRIDHDGKVGIGTTTPDAKLEVVGSNALRIHDGIDEGSILFRGDRNDVYIKESNYQLLFGSPSGMVFELDTNNNDADFFDVTHRGSSRMYINGATGNVGIGTTSPSQKLSISGVKNTPIIHLGSTTNDASWAVGDKIGAIEFGSADGSGAGAGVKASISYEVEAGTTGSSNSMIFRAAGTAAGTNNLERMRIASNGNVGIGTTSPIVKLHARVSSSTTALMLENSAGGGGAYVDLDFNTYNTAQAGFANASASIRVIDNAAYGGDITFRGKTAGIGNTQNELMRIEATGNVGIGTTSPAHKLDVTGTISATGDMRAPIFYDSSNTGYYIDAASTSNLNSLNVATINRNPVVQLSGDVTGSATMTNLGNINITTAVNDDSHNHSFIKAGGTGPSTEDLNSVADSISVGQLSYRGYNLSSTNRPPAADNANGVITVGQHSGHYNAQLAFSSDGNMYWRDNPSTTNGSWRTLWDSGNDGSGSGLDADLLDGQQGSYYAQASLIDTNIKYLGTGVSYDINRTTKVSSGIALYGAYNGGSNSPHSYDFSAQFVGASRGFELSAAWHSQPRLQIRTLRDCCDNWSSFYDVAIHGLNNGAGDLYATAFYDSNNTVYYTNPAGGSYLNYLGVGAAPNTSGSYQINMGGSIDMNAQDIDYVSQLHFNDNVRFFDDGNDSYLNFKYGDASAGGIRIRDNSSAQKGVLYASTDSFGLLDNDGSWALRTRTGTNPLSLYCDGNEEFQVYTSYTLSPGSSRAPIFYDSDNTARYLDPAGTSSLLNINMNNGTLSNVNHITINDPGPNEGIEWIGGNGWKIYESPDNLTTNSGGSLQFVTGSTRRMTIDAAGNVFALGSSRAPIFYDSDNTGYYLNPASTSVLNDVNVSTLNATDMWEGDITIAGDANTYYPVAWYGGSQAEVCEIEIYRNYNEAAPSTWNTATHRGALVFRCTTNFGGWGGVAIDTQVQDFRELYSTMLGWMGTFANSRAFGVRLRGGGAIYHVRIKGRSVGPDVTYGTYDPGGNGTGIGTSTSLDTANILRRRFASGSKLYSYDNLVLDHGGDHQVKSGILESSSSLRAPIFYDSNDTTYYVDPNTTGTSINVRGEISNPSIWINDGDNSNDYNENIRLFNAPNGVSTIAFSASGTGGIPTTSILGYSDRFETRFGSTWQTRVYNGYVAASGSFRAPIFYDSNDTGYYVDPNGLSTQNQARFAGGISVNSGGSSTTKHGVSLYGSQTTGRPAYGLTFTGTAGEGTHGSVTSDWATYFTMSGSTSRGWIFKHETNGVASISGTGSASFNSDVRAPIFYDSDNTGYYTNPASTSVLNALNVNTIHMRDMGDYITFYGNDDANHSIGARDSLGNAADDIRINSYGAVYVNLDSNDNNGSNASFMIGRHGGSIAGGSISDWLLNLDGNTKVLTVASDIIAYGSISDIRKKKNVKKIDSAVDRLKKINGITFNYKNNQPERQTLGVIAQELLDDDILKLAVIEHEDLNAADDDPLKKTYAVKYELLTAVLIEAIKEQQKQIDELKQLINK